jgi:hypothetical protein
MSKDMVYEDVPRFSKRGGDNVIAGANNSTIILGRDRLGPTGTGYGSAGGSDGGKGAGAMHLIVGRNDEDPDIAEDAATVYLSQRCDPDDAAKTVGDGSVKEDLSVIICRADCMRFVPRTDFKLVVGKARITVEADGSIVIDGEISLGKGASQRMIRADAFSQFWSTLVIPTPAGPSGPPPPLPQNVFTTRTKVL